MRHDVPPPGLHVAVIMDGNGRWAAARGRPRLAGHAAGARAARRAIEAAPALGIGALTLFGFSSDNWRRPAAEVAGLMELITRTLRREAAVCARQGVRIRVIGRRDRLPAALLAAVRRAEAATAEGRRLDLRIALDYSSREAIARASLRLSPQEERPREALARVLGEGAPEVDLLVRTGGEQRLSDFLLWESAYAEIVFTPLMWPQFTPADLAAAVREFAARERRFGALPAPA
ncbi:MAG: undecaprenyl diphosphate synthase [Miltoncostaeaceae bacterium]|nr:undecaprenyl diphosphate synthase [Miltoncostaeaceae bacterium]